MSWWFNKSFVSRAAQQSQRRVVETSESESESGRGTERERERCSRDQREQSIGPGSTPTLKYTNDGLAAHDMSR